MTGIKNLKGERGAVTIVEASIVFPIMFILLCFLIYLGQMYYLKAQIDSVVVEKAYEGACYCADPMLESMRANHGAVPSVENLHVEPYRYLLGGMDAVESKISAEVKSEIEGKSKMMLNGTAPKVKTPQADIAKFHNYVLFSTFSVDVECSITFPIRLLGEAAPQIFKVSSHAEVAVSDSAELIRNTDMAIDFLEDTKIGQAIGNAFNKINEVIRKFAAA